MPPTGTLGYDETNNDKFLRTRTRVEGANTVHTEYVKEDAFSPQIDHETSANLSAGANADLTFTAITSAQTGKLSGINVGASVPLKVAIQTVVPARTTRDVIFTRAGETFQWRPPNIDYITLLGDGDNAFGVSITNLETSQAADVYATAFWEEHD